MRSGTKPQAVWCRFPPTERGEPATKRRLIKKQPGMPAPSVTADFSTAILTAARSQDTDISLRRLTLPFFLFSGLLPLSLAGCHESYSPNTYAADAAQQEAPVQRGVIVGVRDVHISADGTIGTAAGGAAGGVAGAQLSGSPEVTALGAIGGALVGGVGGAAAEQAIAATNGWEYIVQETNGNLVSITQTSKTALPIGQHVLVIDGSKQARIVPDYTVQVAASAPTSAHPALAAKTTTPAVTKAASKAASNGSTTAPNQGGLTLPAAVAIGLTASAAQNPASTQATATPAASSSTSGAATAQAAASSSNSATGASSAKTSAVPAQATPGTSSSTLPVSSSSAATPTQASPTLPAAVTSALTALSAQIRCLPQRQRRLRHHPLRQIRLPPRHRQATALPLRDHPPPKLRLRTEVPHGPPPELIGQCIKLGSAAAGWSGRWQRPRARRPPSHRSSPPRPAAGRAARRAGWPVRRPAFAPR